MDLEKARKQIKYNAEAQVLYMKTIDDAEKKLSEDFVEIPYEFSIMIGMIDNYRKMNPKTIKSDEEILAHIENLLSNYDEVNVSGVRDFNVDLDEVIVTLDGIDIVEKIPDIIHVVNSILISSGSTQKMRYFVEDTSSLVTVKDDVAKYINDIIRPIVSNTKD